MTKGRDPLTFELALTKVASKIGWEQCAEIVGQKDRTVRNWSDPDTSAKISLDAALRLDVAFRVAGGEGPPPMFECYAARLEADTATACADLSALNAKIAKAAKEGGEAIAAAIAAAQPGATDSVRARAELELEESRSAITDTLATLRAGRRGDVQSGGGLEGTAATRPGEGNA